MGRENTDLKVSIDLMLSNQDCLGRVVQSKSEALGDTNDKGEKKLRSAKFALE
jgi:hypothetical protein